MAHRLIGIFCYFLLVYKVNTWLVVRPWCAPRARSVSARAGVVARVGELVVRPITWMVEGSGIGDFGQDLERHRCLAVASKRRGRFPLGPGGGAHGASTSAAGAI